MDKNLQRWRVSLAWMINSQAELSDIFRANSGSNETVKFCRDLINQNDRARQKYVVSKMCIILALVSLCTTAERIAEVTFPRSHLFAFLLVSTRSTSSTSLAMLEKLESQVFAV